jgi:hypothetical protein
MISAGSKVLAAVSAPVTLVTWLSLTSILVVSGPFGTFEHCTVVERIACFAPLVAVCLIWGIAARVILMHVIPGLGYWPASAAIILASALALPVPLLSLARATTRIAQDMLPSVTETAVIIVVFGIAAALMRWFMLEDQPSDMAAGEARGASSSRQSAIAPVAMTEGPEAEPELRLMQRLDPDVRGRPVRLSARDHYVEVVTDRGKARLLLRLADAIAELEGCDGMQVHRSHWVARWAVEGGERNRGQWRLVVADGSRIPVSRAYAPLVEASGLLRPPAAIAAERGTARTTLPVSTA